MKSVVGTVCLCLLLTSIECRPHKPRPRLSLFGTEPPPTTQAPQSDPVEGVLSTIVFLAAVGVCCLAIQWANDNYREGKLGQITETEMSSMSTPSAIKNLKEKATDVLGDTKDALDEAKDAVESKLNEVKDAIEGDSKVDKAKDAVGSKLDEAKKAIEGDSKMDEAKDALGTPGAAKIEGKTPKAAESGAKAAESGAS